MSGMDERENERFDIMDAWNELPLCDPAPSTIDLVEISGCDPALVLRIAVAALQASCCQHAE